MDATFRHPRIDRTLGVCGLFAYPAWAVFAAFSVANDPSVPRPVLAGALMAGVPLFMTGVSLWLLLTFRRAELRIQGTRIISRGVVKSRELNLAHVTQARWQSASKDGGTILLRDGAARIVIRLQNYQTDDRAIIVQRLRSAIPPEVQTGWSLFAYKTALLEPPTVRSKPRPGEVLVRRQHWDRYFLPAVVVVTFGGVVAWRLLGQPGFLAAPLFPLAVWALMRFATPAEGMVSKTLSSVVRSDTDRFLPFLLVWFIVGVAGVIAHGVFGPRQTDIDAFLAVGASLWFAILLFEAWRADRQQRRRDLEAAELAAKARGETSSVMWQSEP